MSVVPLGTDPQDGGPVWTPLPGTPLVPGQLAWAPLDTGPDRQTWLCWSVDLWVPTLVRIARPGLPRPRSTGALGREVRALRPLRHPAFPRLIADGTGADQPHVVLEYLDGPSLDEVLDVDGPLAAADTARLGVGLLGAVRALHATRTAHLGIDPGTVLLVDRRVRLVGLGAARRLGGRVPAATDVHGVGATLQAVLDPAEDGGLREVLAALTAADPGDRPTVEEGLALLVPHAGGGVVRPWPRWADRELPRPPGRGRPGLRPA